MRSGSTDEAARPWPCIRAGAERGLWCGIAGGILSGLGETALAWKGAPQFLDQGRIALAVFLVGLEGFAGALVGLGAGMLLALLWFQTSLHEVAHRIRQADGRALLAWSVTLLGALIGLGLLLSQLTLYALLHFHNRALVAKWVGGLSTLIVLGLVLSAFLIQRLVFGLIGLFRVRGSVRTVGIVVAALLVGTAAAIAATNWETVRVLDLRPAAIGMAFVIGALGAWRFGPRLQGLGRKIAWALAPVLLGLALVFGQPAPVRKAASHYTALGGWLVTALRQATDIDRDGYAPILGGGDCNNWDPSIHPGAVDIADDGIDQNCSGQDAHVRSADPQPLSPLPDSVPDPLNLLLVTIDTLRADHMGIYGYGRNTSPRLDQLGRRAIVFENGYSHAPSTRYSMPVILTGRYASQIAWDSACPFTGGCATRWPPPLSESNRLISEMLKSYGYTTAALLGYRFFEPSSGYPQGFDIYDNGRAFLHQGPTDPATHGSSSREQADVAIEFLQRNTPAKWFLWVHFYDPHYYFEDHPETSFGPGEIDRYDSEIRYTDLHIGRLLDQLANRGLAAKTIVIVTGDHGEGFGEHGLLHHGYHLYQAQTHVPFIIFVPGLAPRRVSEPVGHIDLAPTMLNLIRGRPEPTLQGRSVVGLMTGGTEKRRVFQEVLYEGPVIRKSIVTRDWKLIWNMVPDNSFELYHLATDPAETHDLWDTAANQKVQSDLERELSAWVESSPLPGQPAAKK